MGLILFKKTNPNNLKKIKKGKKMSVNPLNKKSLKTLKLAPTLFTEVSHISDVVINIILFQK